MINIGDHRAVKDLSLKREKVTVRHEPEDIVVKLDYPEMKEEEVAAEVTPEQVEITKEKKEEEEGEAGEAATKKGAAAEEGEEKEEEREKKKEKK
jgi:HSP20 family molecular chaperone IbpA